MGMNGGHKAAQAARGAAGASGPEQADDGRVDGSFHSPEFLAGHIASLQPSQRLTYEQFKAQQAAAAKKDLEAAALEESAQQEFRAQLAADREKRLAAARGEAPKKDKHSKKHKKEKHSKDKHSKDKHKHKRRRSRSPEREGKEGKKRRRDSSASDDSRSGSAARFRLSNWRAASE